MSSMQSTSSFGGIAIVTHTHWFPRLTLGIEEGQRVLRTGLAENLAAAAAVVLPSLYICIV